MLRNCYGKLRVYASSSATREKRLQSVSTATEKMAKLLELDFDVVTLKERFSQIYVYYENGDDDQPIPIYCDKGKKYTVQEICSTLRNMMFVLSFHPKHASLKEMRKAIMRFS